MHSKTFWVVAWTQLQVSLSELSITWKSVPPCRKNFIAELDLNLPHTQLPSLNDRPQLPYTEALIQELLRISTIGPFGLLHSAVGDTEVAGYRIPKDTLVIGNLYAVNNYPNMWKNPREFRPERFIDENGKYNSGDEPVIAFGTGKRSCIGEGFARNQLFLFTVQIFQNFRVKPASAPEPSSCVCLQGQRFFSCCNHLYWTPK